MDTYWDLFVSALIGAVVGGAVDLFYKRLDEKFRNLTLQDFLKNTWWRILFYLIIALVVSFVAWRLIYPYYERNLFAFEQGTQSWEPLSGAKDAAKDTGPGESVKALRASYNFAQLDPDDPDPRATFYLDNFDETWAGYKTFQVDVHNPNPEHLELSFSVDIRIDNRDCFHEFGGYRNLSPDERTTVSFDFTRREFKTCTAPAEFDQPLDATQQIERIYLIVGTNERPANFDGAVLIYDIRLQKNIWFLRLGVGAVAFATLVGIAIYEYRRYKQKRPKTSGSLRKGNSSKKGKPNAKPGS
jgi:hypothetical protein